jgi:uncharacterized protein (DUF4415 family)
VVGQKPPKEVLKAIRKAARRPIHYTEDCPESSPEALKEFAMQRAEKNRQKKRKTVSLRLPPECIETYKSIGKGYTGVMAEVLTYASTHPDYLKQAML